MIESIAIKVKEGTIYLPIEDAKNLYIELDELFGKQKSIEVPYVPPYSPNTPIPRPSVPEEDGIWYAAISEEEKE